MILRYERQGKNMKSNTIYPPMSEREISGAAISREAATQGMVLLKNIMKTM